jgi:hypothetical protein
MFSLFLVLRMDPRALCMLSKPLSYTPCRPSFDLLFITLLHGVVEGKEIETVTALVWSIQKTGLLQKFNKAMHLRSLPKG